MTIELNFTSVSSLTRWLEKEKFRRESDEGFYNWLQSFFVEGNTVMVNGEKYDYWSCWELV